MSSKRDLTEVQVSLVVGCGRSGTSWLSQMIHAHPDVAAFAADGTDTFFQAYVLPMLRQYQNEYNRFYSIGMQRGTPARYDRLHFDCLIKKILTEYYKPLIDQDKAIIAQKSVDIDHALQELRKIFPNLKVIHIIRDGRAVCKSLLKERQELGGGFGAADVAEAAERWRDRVTAYQKFGTESPANYFEVRYEELVDNTSFRLSEIFEFLRINASKKQCESISGQFHISKKKIQRPHSIPSEVGAASVKTATSVLRWHQTLVFERIAVRVLVKNSYTCCFGSPALFFSGSTFLFFFKGRKFIRKAYAGVRRSWAASRRILTR